MSLFIFELPETQLDKTEEIHETMGGPDGTKMSFIATFPSRGASFFLNRLLFYAAFMSVLSALEVVLL